MKSLENWFEKVGRRQQLAKAESLFLRGEKSRGPFVLQAGLVRLYRQDENGTEVTLHRVRPGERFAEASVFSDAYHCDCMAELQSIVLAIPRAAIRAALKDDPAFSTLFAELMARQVMDLRFRLELRNIRSAEQRILAALQMRAVATGNPLLIDGALKDFASEIGLTHEALYRGLKKLQDAGKIRRQGHSVEIL